MKTFLHSFLMGMAAVMLISLVSCNEKKEPANQGGNNPTEDTTPDTTPDDKDGSHSTPPPAIVMDNCGNKYGWVQIGDQYWMSENMRCNKYGSKSGWTGDDLKTSVVITFAPFYTNASNKSNWSTNKFSEDLSADQIAKLGYLYNWAAAMAIATETDAKSQSSDFNDKRQGICPDGWHVPTNKEWITLKNFIEKTDGKGEKSAGKHLKSRSGWYQNGNGDNHYSFAALPASFADKGNSICWVGQDAGFWTTAVRNANEAFIAQIGYLDNELSFAVPNKSRAFSVRCVWD